MLAELGKIAASPRRTLSDYDAARAQLRANAAENEELKCMSHEIMI